MEAMLFKRSLKTEPERNRYCLYARDVSLALTSLVTCSVEGLTKIDSFSFQEGSEFSYITNEAVQLSVILYTRSDEVYMRLASEIS